MAKGKKLQSPKMKSQVELEALSGERTLGQIAGQDGMVQQYARRLAEFEQLLGRKEVEIALPRYPWTGTDKHRAQGGAGGEPKPVLRTSRRSGPPRAASIHLALTISGGR